MYRYIKSSSVIILGLGVLMLSGCGSSEKSTVSASDISAQASVPSEKPSSNTFYEAGLVYVKLDKAGAVNNSQPYSISAEDLKKVLSTLKVKETGLLDSSESQLFSTAEVSTYSSPMASALKAASSGQDVTFVTQGTYEGFLSSGIQTNSGRMFVENGKLNIIFGLLHQPFSNKDPLTGLDVDRRTNPYRVGSRKNESNLNVEVVQTPGVSLHSGRDDWVVIDVPVALASAKPDTTKASPAAAAAVAAPAAVSSGQTQTIKNMQGEIQDLKNALFEMGEKLQQLEKKK